MSACARVPVLTCVYVCMCVCVCACQCAHSCLCAHAHVPVQVHMCMCVACTCACGGPGPRARPRYHWQAREEGLFTANAVNEEDPERDRAPRRPEEDEDVYSNDTVAHPRNRNRANRNHLDICLSVPQKNRNSLTWVLVALRGSDPVPCRLTRV